MSALERWNDMDAHGSHDPLIEDVLDAGNDLRDELLAEVQRLTKQYDGAIVLIDHWQQHAEAFAAEHDEMLRTLYRRYIFNGQTYDEWYDHVKKLAGEWVEP